MMEGVGFFHRKMSGTGVGRIIIECDGSSCQESCAAGGSAASATTADVLSTNNSSFSSSRKRNHKTSRKHRKHKTQQSSGSNISSTTASARFPTLTPPNKSPLNQNKESVEDTDYVEKEDNRQLSSSSTKSKSSFKIPAAQSLSEKKLLKRKLKSTTDDRRKSSESEFDSSAAKKTKKSKQLKKSKGKQSQSYQRNQKAVDRPLAVTVDSSKNQWAVPSAVKEKEAVKEKNDFMGFDVPAPPMNGYMDLLSYIPTHPDGDHPFQPQLLKSMSEAEILAQLEAQHRLRIRKHNHHNNYCPSTASSATVSSQSNSETTGVATFGCPSRHGQTCIPDRNYTNNNTDDRNSAATSRRRSITPSQISSIDNDNSTDGQQVATLSGQVATSIPNDGELSSSAVDKVTFSEVVAAAAASPSQYSLELIDGIDFINHRMDLSSHFPSLPLITSTQIIDEAEHSTCQQEHDASGQQQASGGLQDASMALFAAAPKSAAPNVLFEATEPTPSSGEAKGKKEEFGHSASLIVENYPMKELFSDKSYYSCKSCSSMYSRKRDLKLHRRQNCESANDEIVDDPIYHCNSCSFIFPSKQDYESHQPCRISSSISEKAAPVEAEAADSEEKGPKDNDVKIQEDNLRVFNFFPSVKVRPCHYCRLEFVRKRDLRAHIRDVHEATAVCCLQCREGFRDGEELSVHTESAHPATERSDCMAWKIIQCHYCDEVFESKRDRRRHKHLVHADSPVEDSAIDEQEQNKRVEEVENIAALNLTTIKIECKYCIEPFTRKRDRKAHQITCSLRPKEDDKRGPPVEENNDNSATIPQQTEEQKEEPSLQTNMDMDDTVKDDSNNEYPCTVCSASFAHRKQRKAHQKTCSLRPKEDVERRPSVDENNDNSATIPQPKEEQKKEPSQQTNMDMDDTVKDDSNNKYPCAVCSASFAHRRDRKRHVREEHADPPIDEQLSGAPSDTGKTSDTTPNSPIVSRAQKTSSNSILNPPIVSTKKTSSSDSTPNPPVVTSQKTSSKNSTPNPPIVSIQKARKGLSISTTAQSRRPSFLTQIKSLAATATTDPCSSSSADESSAFQADHDEQEIRCDYCPEAFVGSNKRRELHRHINEAHTEYACRICRQIFSSKPALTNHCLRIEFCPTSGCDKAYCDRARLERHRRKKKCGSSSSNREPSMDEKSGEDDPSAASVSGGSKKQFCCPDCNREFEYFESLKDHIEQEHHQQQGKKLKCRHCESNFSSLEKLVTHEIRRHADRRAYECQKCDGRFDNIFVLSNHLKIAHPTEVCSKCNKEFSKCSDLSVHVVGEWLVDPSTGSPDRELRPRVSPVKYDEQLSVPSKKSTASKPSNSAKKSGSKSAKALPLFDDAQKDSNQSNANQTEEQLVSKNSNFVPKKSSSKSENKTSPIEAEKFGAAQTDEQLVVSKSSNSSGKSSKSAKNLPRNVTTRIDSDSFHLPAALTEKLVPKDSNSSVAYGGETNATTQPKTEDSSLPLRDSAENMTPTKEDGKTPATKTPGRRKRAAATATTAGEEKELSAKTPAKKKSNSNSQSAVKTPSSKRSSSSQKTPAAAETQSPRTKKEKHKCETCETFYSRANDLRKHCSTQMHKRNLLSGKYGPEYTSHLKNDGPE